MNQKEQMIEALEGLTQKDIKVILKFIEGYKQAMGTIKSKK